MRFPPISDPPQYFFFKNRALSLLYPYGALTSWKKLENTNEQSLRYSKTDTRTDGHTHRRTHGHGRLLRTPSGKPRVQNQTIKCLSNYGSLFPSHPTEYSCRITCRARILCISHQVGPSFLSYPKVPLAKTYPFGSASSLFSSIITFGVSLK